MVEVDFNEVRQVLEKLLNKAGKDPRLTPKLLRAKTESKLQLAAGQLKPYRKDIKKVIWEWWESDQRKTLIQLVSLARALQLAPGILKGLKEMGSDTERVETLAERLKERKVEFSSCPTDEEIETLKREADRQRSLEEVDVSLIIEGKRKRSELSANENIGNDRKKRVIADDDEEAEF